MTDPIDEIIKREWEDWFPERASEFEHQRLRAVCKAGIKAGERKLAREVLGVVMRDGELPIFRDEREIQMLVKLEKIAGEGEA